MKHLIGPMMFAVILSFGTATLTSAANEMPASGSRTIKGDVLKIEGDVYTVHDTAGHEVPLHVDKTTRMEGTVRIGEKVEAQVTEKGHAVSIKLVNESGGGMAALGPQTVKGDVLKIEGEIYTVHDTAGHEVRLHVDKTTKLEGAFKAGDKVVAQVTDKGHALSIEHVQRAK